MAISIQGRLAARREAPFHIQMAVEARSVVPGEAQIAGKIVGCSGRMADLKRAREVVRALVRSHMAPEQLEGLLDSASFVSCEHTGVGYFLTVSHPALPHSRIVCDTPAVVGRTRGIECGFVVFLEGGELTLECHSWGDEPLPADLRERALAIQAAA